MPAAPERITESTSAKRARLRMKAKRIVPQEPLMRRCVAILNTAHSNGEIKSWSWLAQHAINPHTKKPVSATTISSWRSDFVRGSLSRTMNAVLKPLGKKLDIVEEH